MKKDMPLEGLRWSRDSGSALYDTPQNGRSRTGWGGVNCSALNGNLLVLQKYSQKYSVANVSKRQTTQKVQFHTYHPRHSTMAWMDLSATRAA